MGEPRGHSQPQLFSSNPLLWATNRTQPATALQFQPSSVGDQQDTASHSSSVPTLFCGRPTGHSQPQLFSSNPLLWASNGTQPATALQFQPSSVGEQRDTASHSSSVPTLFCGRPTGHSQPQLFSSNPLLWATNRTQPATALQFQPSSVGNQRDTASHSSSVPTLFCGRATGHSQPQLFSSNPLLWASNGTQPATALQFQPSSVGEQRDTASRSSSVPTLFCGRATGHSQPQLFSSNPLLWASHGDTASHSSSVPTLFCGRPTGHSQPQLFSSNPLLWATNRTQPATALQFQPSSVGDQQDTASHSSSVPTLFCGRATGHSQPQLFSSNPLLWVSNGTQPATALQFQPSSVGDQQDTASHSSSVPTLFCGRPTGHSQPQLFSSNPLLWATNGTQPATALQFQPSSVGDQQDTASRSSSVPTLFCGATNRTQPAIALQFQVQPQHGVHLTHCRSCQRVFDRSRRVRHRSHRRCCLSTLEEFLVSPFPTCSATPAKYWSRKSIKVKLLT